MSDESLLAQLVIEAVQLDRAGVAVSAVGARDDGRRVLVGAFEACGECDVCRRGGAPVCPRGPHRELAVGARATMSTRWQVVLGDGLELPGASAAAAAGDLALAYTMYARTGVAPRDPVIVIGGDPVARFAVEVLLAKGVAPVIVADGEPAWAHAARARGAAIAAASPTTRDDELAAAIRAALAQLADDPAAARAGGKPWRLLATEQLPRALALAGPRSTVTALAAALAAGDHAAATASALAGALAREVALLGVRAPHPELVLEAAALAATGAIDFAAAVAVRAPDEPRGDRSRSDVVAR